MDISSVNLSIPTYLTLKISRWPGLGRFILAVGRVFAVYNREQKRDDAATL